MPRGIEFFRSVPRWLLVRNLAGFRPSVATGALSCIRLKELAPPPLPNAQWVRIKPRLSGICGSDLSAIACKGSPYFSPFVSTPFVLGHELVGELVEVGSEVSPNWKVGQRVVLEPALSCTVRGIQPPCAPCANGYYAHCENILRGCIKGGIQTGYCASTGGGWSEATLVAHQSQLHAVPEILSPEEAVLAEPFACAVHAALKAPREASATLLILGCGTIGLLTLYAYRANGGKGRVLVAARHKQQADIAQTYGSNEIFRGRGFAELYRWVLTQTQAAGTPALLHQPELGKPIVLGGVDCVLDCVGSSQSIDDAMRLTAPRGTLLLVGMPGIPKGVDWTSVWYKELRVQGCYAYGFEDRTEGEKTERVRTMQLALQFLVNGKGALRPLVNRCYTLDQYRQALAGAFNTGQSGAFKTIFELR